MRLGRKSGRAGKGRAGKVGGARGEEKEKEKENVGMPINASNIN